MDQRGHTVDDRFDSHHLKSGKSIAPRPIVNPIGISARCPEPVLGALGSETASSRKGYVGGEASCIAAAARPMVMSAAVWFPLRRLRNEDSRGRPPPAADQRAPVGGSRKQNSRSTDVAANSASSPEHVWLQVDNWPVSFTGGANACWLGGRIIGTFSQSTRWDQFHHTGGVNFQNDRFTLLGLRVHNYGDGIRVRDGARDFTISGVHLSFIHDDCIENDQLYSGTVKDSLLDGCYVAFSARPSSGDPVDGHANTGRR